MVHLTSTEQRRDDRKQQREKTDPCSKAGLGLAAWSERWFPDAWGWVVQIYNASEALPNPNPFSMLPLLGLLRIKARDLVGYSVLQMFIHIPLVFFLWWLSAQSIPFVPPMEVRPQAPGRRWFLACPLVRP
jgi:hypothetical protein